MPTLVLLWLNYEYCFLTLCKFSFVKIYGHSEICWPHLFWNKLPFTQIFWDNDNRCKGINQLPLTCWQWCTRCRNTIFLKLRCKPFRFERMLVFMSTGCVKPSDCPASASNCVNGVCQGSSGRFYKYFSFMKTISILILSYLQSYHDWIEDVLVSCIQLWYIHWLGRHKCLIVL